MREIVWLRITIGFLFLFVCASLVAQRQAYHLALHRQAKTIKPFASLDAAPIIPSPTLRPLVLDQFIAERSDQWIGADAVWQAVDSLEYEYNIEGVLLNIKIRVPNEGMWSFYQRIDYNYDGNGLLVQATESSWLNNEWQATENDDRVTWVYNEMEQLSAKVNQDWQAGTWQDTYQELYDYDTPGGDLATFTGQVSLDGDWVNDFQIRYVDYDIQGNLLTEEQYDWVVDTWVATIRIERSYNADNQLEELSVIAFIDNTWQVAYRRTYQYNSNGFLLEWLQESWAEETQIWRPFFRELYERDIADNLSYLNSQSWNTSDSIWRNVLKTTYGYDNQDNNTLIYSQRWNSLLQDWENYFRTFLYYGDGLTTIKEVQDFTLNYNVFPNPSNDQLTIKFTQELEEPIKLNVWSMTAKKMQPLSICYKNNEEIELSVSNLPAGSYVLELISKKGKTTHQIQVVK